MPNACPASHARRARFSLTLIALLAAGLAAVTSAQAAYTAIDPVQLYASPGISDVVAGVSPNGDGITIFGNGGNELPFRLGAVSRSATGTLSGVQELSASANAQSPERIAFDAGGNGFAAWGVATTGAFGQFASRPPSGIFSVTSSFGNDAPDCRRYFDTAFAPDGTLLVACSTTTAAPPPNNQSVRILTRLPAGIGFDDDVLPFGSSDDDSPDIRLAIGADGTRALAVREDPSASDPVIQVWVDPAGPAAPATTTFPSSASLFLDDLAVLSNGSVIVVSTDSGGVSARVRPAGDATAFASPQLIDAQPADAQVEPDATGAALIVLARQLVEGGPVTTLVASRAANGTLTGPTVLETSTTAAPGRLQVAASGLAVIARQRGAGPANSPPAQLSAWVRPPGASAFTGPVVIAEPACDGSMAISPTGDILAAWANTVAPGDARLFAGGLDVGSAPAISNVAAPARALVGEPAAFAASASDWSGIRTVQWTFGDGGSAAGDAVSHVYGTPGSYVVSVRATDRGGNVSEQQRTVQVVTAGASSPDHEAPALTVLTKSRLTRTQFLRKGVSVRISANEPATVLAELLARAKGAKISAVPFNLALGSRTARGVQNSVTVKIKPNRSLVGKARRFSIRLRLTAEDAAGNRRVTGKTIKVAG